MNWGEFKTKMEQAGVTDATELDFIDVSFDGVGLDVDFTREGRAFVFDDHSLPGVAK